MVTRSTPRAILLSPRLLLCLSAALAPSSFANPSGEHVTAGSATFGRSGNALQVTTASQSTVIDWQSFSIGANERTRFLQPSTDAATLNRVTSGNPSEIYGSLESNGKLFLINPNGIVVGLTGRIDTAGFLASTLNLSNADFLARGDLHLTGSSTATIENRGTIHALGGDVYLLGASVINSGTVSAPTGIVGLGAGNDILIKQVGDERVTIRPAASAGAVNNSGLVEAVQAELKAHGNIYALAINNSGIVRATGVATRNGRVLLTSQSGTVSNSGHLIAKTQRGGGGAVRIHGGTVLVSGTVDASGRAGGTTGGSVYLSGSNVGLFPGGKIDVSGDAGGGTALIGGGLHGGDPAIPNALHTFVSGSATIQADALSSGPGGKVVVWSDNATRFYGSISAHGGALGGDGGFAEVSGKQYLDFKATTALHGGPGGKPGTLLLDPQDIVISGSSDENTVFLSSTNTSVAFADAPAFGVSTLDVTPDTGSFAGVGDGATVILQATNNITVNAGLNLLLATGNADVSLTLRAGNDINVNAPIIASGAGALLLNANDATSGLASGTGGIYINSGGSLIAQGAGAIDMHGTQINISSGARVATVGGGDITITGGAILVAGGISAPGALVTLNSSANITETGTGNIRGDVLAVNSVSGAALTGSNSVNYVSFSNQGSGDIVFNNASPVLRVTAVSQTGGENVVLSNTGALILPPSLDVTGTASLSGATLSGTTDFGGSTASFTVTSSAALHVGADSLAGNDILLSAPLAALGNVSSAGSFAIDTGGTDLTVTGVVSTRGISLNTGTAAILVNSGAALAANNGPLVLTSDSISLQGHVTGYGQARFQTYTSTLGMAIGTAASGTDYRIDDVSLTQIGSDFAGVNFGAITSGQTITVNTPVQIGSALIFTAPQHGGTIQIEGPLQTTGYGSVTINSSIINLIAAPTITTAHQDVSLTGNIYLYDNATIATAGGAFTQLGAINGATADALGHVTAYSLTLSTGAGPISFLGSTSNQQYGSIGILQSLDLQTTGVINLQPDISTLGDQTYGSPGNTNTINRIGNGRSRSYANGVITFNGALVSGSGLALGVSSSGTAGIGGAVIFNGPVHASTGGLSVAADTISFNGGANSVTGSGPIAIAQGNSAQTLEVGGTSNFGAMQIDSTLLAAIAPGHGTFTFGSSVSGPVVIDSGLTLAGPVTFASGSTVSLAGSLSTTGTLSFLGRNNLLEGSITTANAPISFQAVQLTGSLSISSGTTNAPVTFLSTVNGTPATPTDLTVRTGTGAIVFTGAVGTVNPILGAVDLGTSGSTAIKSGLVANSLVTGTQTHMGVTQLSSTIRALSSSGIVFGNNVSLLGVTSVVSPGTLTFSGSLAGTTATRLTVQTPNDLVQIGSWNLPGSVSLQANNITLAGTNNVFGTVQLAAANNVTLLENGATDIGASSVGGNLTVVSRGAITDSGSMGVTGTSAFTSNSAITLDTATNAFNGPILLSGSSTATLVNTADTLLVNPNLPGQLKITAPGHNVTVTNASGNYGSLAITGSTATIVSSTNVKIGASTLSGSLSLTASGSVSQSGPVVITGTQGVSIATTGTCGIVFDNASNRLVGPISLSTVNGASATVQTLGNAVLNEVSIDGNLNVKCSGSLGQLGALTVGGSASFTSVGALMLADGGNSIGEAVTLTGGNVTFGGDFPSLAAVRATTLTVNVGHEITQSGPWRVAGLTTLTATSNDIVLSNTTNSFGTLRMTGYDVTVNEFGATDLGTSDINGTLYVKSSGAITDSGAVTVGGPATFIAGGAITLRQPGSTYSSPVSLASGGVSNVVFVNGVTTTLSSVQVGGNLTVQSKGDIAAGSSPVNVLGTATFQTGTGNSVTLNDSVGRIGTLSLVTHDALIVSGTTVRLGTTLIPGALSVTAVGAISQVGALTVGGASTFQTSAPNASISLVNALNAFSGPLSVITYGTANSSSIRGRSSITLVSSTIQGTLSLSTSGTLGIVDPTNSIATYGSLSAGRLTLFSSSDVVQNAPWTISGPAILNVGSHDIVLTATNSFKGLDLTGRNVAITQSGAALLTQATIAGNLSLRTSGSISQTGALAVAGTLSLSSGQSITLTSATNQLSTLGNITANSNIAISNANALAISGSVSGIDITLKASGNLHLFGDELITGRYISLASLGGFFINESSTAGITNISGGHYEIFSSSMGSVVKGNLTAGNATSYRATQPPFTLSGSSVFYFSHP